MPRELVIQLLAMQAGGQCVGILNKLQVKLAVDVLTRQLLHC